MAKRTHAPEQFSQLKLRVGDEYRKLTGHKRTNGWLSNYCGPGGSGIPQHATDQLCADHDYQYGVLEAEGRNPYYYFNDADRQFIISLKKRRTDADWDQASAKEKAVNLGAEAYFRSKYLVAPHDRGSVEEVALMWRDKNGFWQTGTPPPGAEQYDETQDTQAETDTEMADDTTTRPPAPMALAASGTTSAKSTGFGMKETPITKAPAYWGLPETHTAELVTTIWGSVQGGTQDSPNDIVFDMTYPELPIVNTMTSKSVGDAIINGMANCGLSLPSINTYGFRFPAQRAQTCQPGYWQFYKKQYRTYTVLNCNWSMLWQNAGYKGSGDIAVNERYETWSDTDNTNKTPTAVPYATALEWPGNKWKYLEGTYDGTSSALKTGRQFEKSTGNYKPGQGNRLVLNDQDTKTWHKVGTPPTLREQLRFQVYTGPFAYNTARCNFEITLKYSVQFKDPINQVDFVQGSTVALNLPNDLVSLNTAPT